MSNSVTSPPPPPPTAAKAQVIDRAVRRSMIAELPAELQRLRRVVLTDSMANGTPVRPAALCAVLAAHCDLADAPLTFTAAHVEELLWCGVHEYCEDVGLEVPNGCREALHAVLAAASALGLFDGNSDSAAEIFGVFRQLVAS